MERGRNSGRVHGVFTICLVLGAALALPLAACTAPSSYMGISLSPDSANPTLQTLAREAQLGDRQAKFALAGRLERGDGVAQNTRQAKLLYAEVMAARGGRWIHPASGQGKARAPVLTGVQASDDLSRAASERLKILAQMPELELRWAIARGHFDGVETGDPDEVIVDRACAAIVGEFAPLIVPHPLPDNCASRGYRQRGSKEIYSSVSYTDAISDRAAREDIYGDYQERGRLELTPRPAFGAYGEYDVLQLIKDGQVVANILVCTRRAGDKKCGNLPQAIPLDPVVNSPRY